MSNVVECIWLACDTQFSFISLNWHNEDRVLQNFKLRTQRSYVCGPTITLLQDIQVSNFVALVGTIGAGVNTGGSRRVQTPLLEPEKYKKNL